MTKGENPAAHLVIVRGFEFHRGRIPISCRLSQAGLRLAKSARAPAKPTRRMLIGRELFAETM
jgi:hypothetical protein